MDGSGRGRERHGGAGFAAGKIAIGLTGFAALAGLGAFVTGWLDRGGGTLIGAARAMPWLLTAALGLLAVDLLLGGLRLHVWLRRLAPGARYTVSLQTYLVNLFASAILPLAAASAPAQIATLVRGGVRPARAVAALLLTFIGVLSALLLLGGAAAAYLLATTDLAARLGGVQRAALVASVMAAMLLLAALLNPRVGELLACWLFAAGRRLGGRVGRGAVRLAERLGRGAAEYRAALRAARDGWQVPFAGSLGISVAMLLNKCAIAFLVAAGLGSAAGYVDVAARHALQSLFLYFSPSPGQSGLAEASVPAFMAGVLPEGRWLEFTVLWRALSSYVGVAIGAAAAIYLFGRRRAGPGADLAAGGGEGKEDGPRVVYRAKLAPALTASGERPRSTQFTLPNSCGRNSGLRTEPG